MFFFKMTTWNIKYNISIRLIKRVKTFIISVTGLVYFETSSYS